MSNEKLLPQAVTRKAFTVAEVASQCGVARDSIYRAIYRGQLKRLAGFGRFMISESELQRFLSVTKS
jgi:excisionase family DNA binding protein